MSAVPKILLSDLQPPFSGIVSPQYTTSVEKLAVALSRSRVAIITADSFKAAALKAGLSSMLTSGSRSLPGCNMREWCVGGPTAQSSIEEAYGCLESTARLVLAALCRSSVLRLRADAFLGVLDDLPLSRGVQGSSLLLARSYLDNFSHLSGAQGSAALPLFVDPQEEVTERGLLSVFYAQEACDAEANVMSAMQVKDSDGHWLDVQLRPNEMAVVLGHSMQHATAGLLQAGCHRVVGDPYGSDSGKSTGRQVLQFELRPRPAAVLDFRTQLEAAGHMVSSRHSPMSVRSLMEQFEALLSPASKVVTPDQQQGAAAHVAWEELQATLKKKKKRSSSIHGSAGAGRPVTRSGNVRRSAEGLVNHQRPSSRLRQQAPSSAAEKENGGMDWEGDLTRQGSQPTRRASGSSAAASAGFQMDSASGTASASAAAGSSRRRDSLEPSTGSALYVVRGRTCTVLDGCLQDDPAQCITVCVRSFTGLERWFYVSKSIRCGHIFEMYSTRLGINLGAVQFLLRGERVFGASTPASLNMVDGDELTAVPESTDRLQQARELGPLFASVFGVAATVGLSGLPELL